MPPNLLTLRLHLVWWIHGRQRPLRINKCEWLKQCLYYQFNDVASLKQEITNAWGTIGQETLQVLSKSMPDRIFAVARANGGPTKH